MQGSGDSCQKSSRAQKLIDFLHLGDNRRIDQGEFAAAAASFDTSDCDTNNLKLTVRDIDVQLYLNVTLIATTTSDPAIGDAAVATGFFPNSQTLHGATNYENFTVTPGE